LKANLASGLACERIFATNAALTNEFIGIGTARSHFGPADSWVIKLSGRQFLPWKINYSGQTLGLGLPFGVSLSIRVRPIEA
jgi:hypothetical protein